MWTMSPVIVFIMLFGLSLCDDWSDDYDTGPPPTTPPEPDWGSPEVFLKEVNEYRAKFAKEHKIPNMHKLFWSSELEIDLERKQPHLLEIYRDFTLKSYHNSTEAITKQLWDLRSQIDTDAMAYSSERYGAIELLNPLQQLIGCSPKLDQRNWILRCFSGYGELLNFRFSEHGDAGSRCPPRFRGEDGLCVPVDPSKNTFWGTEVQLLEDVNYMRRKVANEFGIPNMHQLTWNEPLVGILKTLDVTKRFSEYLATGSWDGFEKSWRISELQTFASSVTVIDEVVHRLALGKPTHIWGAVQFAPSKELILPLQTSIGCMRRERQMEVPGSFWNYTLVLCLLGNVGPWPTDLKFDVNSTKIPGSECMDGYVNDDGLCSIPLPTTTSKPVPTVPKKPEVTGAPVKEAVATESEQEEAESSSSTKFSYGLWIIYLFLFFF